MSESARVPAATLRTLGVIGACLVATLGAALAVRHYLIAGAEPPATETAAVYPMPRPLPPFALIAHDGSRYDRARLLGRYTFVYFGYTNCPDLCPTTLGELAQATRLVASLGAADRPALIMISVDPQRDTPAVLARYVAHFDPRFVGVSGDEAEVATLAAALGAAYQRGVEVDGSYPVDHTAALFLIDPEARLAAVFPAPHRARTIANDYRAILAARAHG